LILSFWLNWFVVKLLELLAQTRIRNLAASPLRISVFEKPNEFVDHFQS